MSKVYVIHENSEWTVHLTKRLEELDVPYEEWHLDEGSLDLSKEPPEGIFYSRMSASSHTRDHRYAAEFTGQVLAWLEHMDVQF
jgi:GMP synthase-like glutamine amidotransferase